MSNEGFNSEDIGDILSRFGRGHKKSARPATAGIPSFVPREPAVQSIVNTPQNEEVWAAAADRAEQQQQAQELSPASPCFSQADIDELLARKPKKYQMTARDYKELGRNIFLGAGDLIVSTVHAAAVTAPIVLSSKTQGTDSHSERYIRDDGEMGSGPGDGWKINI